MSKFLLFLLAVMSWGLCAQAKELLDIKGDYLLYSFDFNYVYGQGNILIKAKEFSIQAATVEIDMANRVGPGQSELPACRWAKKITRPIFWKSTSMI